METKITRENWEVLKTFLPRGWEKEAVSLGALVRKRKIHSPAISYLFHLKYSKYPENIVNIDFERNISF